MENNKEMQDSINPATPDPFWPEGAVPQHLAPTDKKDDAVDAAWQAVGVDLNWRCADCGITGQENRSPKDPLFCNACYQKRVTSSQLARTTNENWQEQSEALGLALYERQPEETDTEWRIWNEYRKYYPMKLPTWTALAKECGCSVATVTRTAQRWSFKARMIAWARFTDDDTQEKRIKAIREMNQKQLGMAQTIQSKLADAIDMIDPALLRPGEIVNLFKVSTELERRITTAQEEKIESSVVAAGNTAKPRTKAEDLQEVMSILQSTGVMGAGPKIVGVEQKTTVLVKEED